MPVHYRLDRPAARPTVAPPVLDPTQRAVLDHFGEGPGGPLLVLAGPGTGKTTTLVELVVDRIERGGLDPDQVLVLTFGRKAAQEVRARIARRLSRTTSSSPAMTFHSFAYALLRAEQVGSGVGQPLRLLSAPEFDTAITTVLEGGDPARWPTALRPALRTRGMAAELRGFLAAARAQGMDALDVIETGRRTKRPDWVAAGEFAEELGGVAALEGTIDHTDLIFQATRLLDDDATRERWRRRFRLVVVDEYQDTDPLQVELLQALAGDGRDLVVVGDPYQSIYGFRGADVHGITGFADTFGAEVLTLGVTNRYGERIAAAVRSVVENRGALGQVDGPAYAELRSPRTRSAEPGTVDVRTFGTATAESEHVALLLREAHLHDGMPWRDMAVLVRSGADLARVQRTLSGAGVPVAVAGDELPLAVEPAVRTLLAALHAADTLSRGEDLEPEVAESLLTGPLGHLDAAGLRRLGRVLRRAEPDQPRSSRVLVAEALGQPVWLESLQAPGPAGHAVRSAGRLARLLATAAQQIRDGETAELVLWTLWDGTSWPHRLLAGAESGGEGSPRAHHDLDALCALFTEAARVEERVERSSVVQVARLLEAQQIPADTLAQSSLGGDSVQLMTAHRSKGLQWRLVVVAGVQDGTWPDVRIRSSLLQGARLAPGAQLPPSSPTTSLREERRLFYVACSRARERLVVTAVQSASEDGDQPSRFLVELAGAMGTPLVAEGRPRRSLSLRGAVARLRAIGESTDDPAVRDRAAALLARLADHPAGRPADPDRWWGLRDRTQAEVPVRDVETPLQLSGSQLDALTGCPLRWFAGHEARGDGGTTSAQGFGSIVHALAADAVRRGVEPEVDEMAAHLDAVWGQLGLHPWVAERERAAAVEALEKFVHWHRRTSTARQVLAAEHPFEVTADIDGRDVTLRGSMDRVELTADGGVVVVDLKTAKKAPTMAEAVRHPQMSVYQLAVEHGATADLAPEAPAAGAELVYLRTENKSATVRSQPSASEPAFVGLEQLREAIRTVDGEQFHAVVGPACSYCTFARICPAQDAGATILDGGQGPA